MTAIHTKDTVLKRGDGEVSESFNAIGDVLSISGPDGQAQEIDTTNLDSAAKEFLMGLPDNGSITVEMNYDPADAQQAGLLTDRNNQTQRNFEIVFSDPGTTTFSFAAFVTQWATASAVDDVSKLSSTLRVTGIVTVA